MNRKDVPLTILVIILVLLFGLVGYLVIKKKSAPLPHPTLTSKDITVGMLLGFYSLKTDSYRTLWILPQENTAKIVELPNLLVPRERGFLQVGHDYKVEIDGEAIFPGTDEPVPDKSLIEFIWTVPVNKESGLRPVSANNLAMGEFFNQSYCSEKSVPIQFLSTKFISYIDSAGYVCGVHPDGERVFVVSPLENFSGSSLSITDVLGNRGAHAFNNGLEDERKRYYKRWSDSGQSCTSETRTNQTNWRIIRNKGKWVAQGSADTHRLCGYSFEFDIPLRLPESVVGYNDLLLPWEGIVQQVQDAVDALSSPTKDILVVFTPSELKVFRVRGSTIGDLISQVPLYSFSSAPTVEGSWERVVMVQWATGEQVLLWDMEIDEFLINQDTSKTNIKL